MLTVIREMADRGAERAGHARRRTSCWPPSRRPAGWPSRTHHGPAAGAAQGRRRRRRRLRPARALPRPGRRHRRAHARRRRRSIARHGSPCCVDAGRRVACAGAARGVGALRVPLLHEPADHGRGHRHARPSRPSCSPSATAPSSSATQRLVKVHVHTNDPGVVLSEALKHGTIGEVEINDMHEQTKARDERLQQRARGRGHRRRRRRRRRGQQGALPRAGLPRHRRRRPVHEPQRRAAAEGGRGARRRRGRAAAQQRQRHPHRRAGRRHEQPPRGRRAVQVHPDGSVRHGRLRSRCGRRRQRSPHGGRHPRRARRRGHARGARLRARRRAGASRVRRWASWTATSSWPPTRSRPPSPACSRPSRTATPKFVTVLTSLNGSGVTREQLEAVAARAPARRRGPLPRRRPAPVPDPCERRMTDLLTLDNTAIVLDSTCDPPDGLLRPRRPLHGAAQGPLRRRDVPRRRRHDLQGVLREARGVGGAAHDLAAHGRRVRGRLRARRRAATSTSSRCTSPAR